MVRQGFSASASNRLLGDILLLGTGVARALYNLATRRLVSRYSALTVVFWQTLFGAAAFLPLAALEIGAWHLPSVQRLAGIAFLVTLCSVAAFVLYARGFVSLEPSFAVGLLNLVPLFGVLFAWIALAEQVTLAQIVGGFVVVAGITLILRKTKRRDEAAERRKLAA